MARPIVDGLERDLQGRATVLRINLLSPVGATLAQRYGIRGLPTLMVFDGAGRATYSRAGIPDPGEVLAAVGD